MDATVLYNLTYGLYVVGAMDGNRPVGCIINTCFQVTSQNPILAISLNKNNFTLQAIQKTKRFSLSIIAEESNCSVITTFGFQSSRTVDKYADYGVEMTDGIPAVKGKFAGRLFLEVLNMVDNETHMVVLARLINTEKGEGKAMTYEYYHRVIKGKAPKNAPTYRGGDEEDAKPKACDTTKKRWVCDICGYVYEGAELPEDFVCPICGAGREHFKLQ